MHSFIHLLMINHFSYTTNMADQENDDIEIDIQNINHRLDGIYDGSDRSINNYMITQSLVYKTSQRHDVGGKQLLIKSFRVYMSKRLEKIHEDVMSKGDGDLLYEYCREWENLSVGTKLTTHIYRIYTRAYKTDPIYQVAIDVWRQVILEPSHEKIVTTIIKLINLERKGATVNTSAIKTFISTTMELGKKNEKDNLDVYQKYFEEPFIREMVIFYSHTNAFGLLESEICLSEYLCEVEKWLYLDKQRIALHFHTSTVEKLDKIYVNAMVRENLPILTEKIIKRLTTQNLGEANRLYNIVSLLGEPLPDLYKSFGVYIQKKLDVLVQQILQECNRNLNERIKTVARFYQDSSRLVRSVFSNDSCFNTALDQIFATMINKNEYTRGTNCSRQASEMLARYCSKIICLNCSDNEDMLQDAMIIYTFIDDKDLFQQTYYRCFAKRLLHNSSTNDDPELLVISKLKQTCGSDFVRKLRQMYQDAVLARRLNRRFRQQMDPSEKIECHMMILKSWLWPFSPGESSKFVVPQVLTPGINMITAYYTEIHSNRKVKWLFGKSWGQVVANCFDTTYTFCMSTYSMAVLLHYNEKKTFKIYELAELTQICMDDLIQIIQMFIRAKILMCTSPEAITNLRQTSNIQLKESFYSQRLKMNLKIGSRANSDQDDAYAQKYIEQSRVHQVGAAIVRIMKSQKVMSHEQLIEQLLQQMKMSQFIPTSLMIKKCIKNLIHREYIQRKLEKTPVYEYIS